ncbi:hypothetical protein shim_25700 [Shimia sp. SK013]|uniref:hypothetical protein n=1 Tax=Shimia sp. SK013 TaxID=1389006 RepID=UPI0006B45A24|nr:hypothetical protein [Shimia sp. SK013]KPA21105.1 hypothetical protein shim_25700 [Shimia sp. SK013]
MSQIPKLPDDIRLHPDEHLIALWRPALSVFLRKLAFVSILTAACVNPILVSFTEFRGLLAWPISLLLGAVFYAFVFDDVFEWRQRRDDHWVLTNWRILFVNLSDEAEPATMSLADCDTAKSWMWWSVRLRLQPHGAMMMPYLRDRRDVAQKINAAVTAYKASEAKT